MFSDLSPSGRVERWFIQPLDLTSETLVSPTEGGRGGGRYLLVASAEAIGEAEKVQRITDGSRRFALVRRELMTGGGLDHIECLLRCVGRDENA